MPDVDLSGLDIVDAHTHPYRLDDLRSKGSTGFDTRMMFLGESFLSSSQMKDELWPVADSFTDSTVFALAMRRWLADHLGCEPTRAAVTEAREAAIRQDAVASERDRSRQRRPAAATQRVRDLQHRNGSGSI